MIISIDPASAVPTFEQVRGQIAQMIAAGTLATGTRLPTIRQLAADLGLAPGTIGRAYRELESEGLVHGRVRHGTVVAPTLHTSTRTRAELVEAARAFALTARRLGVSTERATRAVRAELERLGP